MVGIPGKWSTEVLADAIEAHTEFRLVIDMAHVVLDLETRQLRFQEHDLCGLDSLIIKKISAEYAPSTIDRLELLRVAESAGVRVFSSAEKILRLIDRLSCTVTLANANIPMPPTVITEDIDHAMETVRQYGSAVFKPLFSTKARGMQIIEATQPDLRNTIEAFHASNPVMYIQRRLDLPGQDLGLVFLDGQYLGCYARVSADDAWNTTIHSGGKYAAYDPPQEWVEIARRAQAPFGLDFTTVDLAETGTGPVVFEVSAFGGFRGALEGAGIDAASAYAKHVLEQLKSS